MLNLSDIGKVFHVIVWGLCCYHWIYFIKMTLCWLLQAGLAIYSHLLTCLCGIFWQSLILSSIISYLHIQIRSNLLNLFTLGIYFFLKSHVSGSFWIYIVALCPSLFSLIFISFFTCLPNRFILFSAVVNL